MSTVNLYNVKPDQVKMLWQCIARLYGTWMRLSCARALSPSPHSYLRTTGLTQFFVTYRRVFCPACLNMRIFLIVSWRHLILHDGFCVLRVSDTLNSIYLKKLLWGSHIGTKIYLSSAISKRLTGLFSNMNLHVFSFHYVLTCKNVA